MGKHKVSKKFLIDILVILLVFGLLYVAYLVGHPPTNNGSIQIGSKGGYINKKLYSLSNPDSIWVVINKQRPIVPSNYIPSGMVIPNVPISKYSEYPPVMLQFVASNALQNMFSSAKNQNINLTLVGGYHSVIYQQSIYNGYQIASGQPGPYSSIFKPGYDEQQVGLSAAIGTKNGTCIKLTCFASTPQGEWLSKNSYKFGFIVRYPDGQQGITGVSFEPWLFRYVGVQLATKLYLNNNESMEEFFGLPSAVNYKE